VLPERLAAAARPHAVLLFHEADWLFEPSAGGAGPRLLELAASRRPPTVLETRDPGLATVAGPAGLPHVALPFPERAARAELWRRLAWRAHPLFELDIEALASAEVPGAEIERALETVLDGWTAQGLPGTSDLLATLAARRRGRPPLP
jgi:hypothetical protein